MALLKLSAEAVHLRRVARAHGAGECSQREYREARSQIIEHFARQPRAEDTERRDDTMRTLDRTERSVATDRSANEAQFDPEPTWRQLLRSRKCHLMLLWLLVSIALIASLPSIAAEEPSDSAASVGAAVIPAVRDRDPNPATSARLEVRRVRLPGLVTDAGEPRYSGLDPLAVSARIESAVASVRERHALGPHGFSDPELQEVGRLLSAFGVHDGSPQLSAQESQALLDLIATQKERRGISVLELEQVAEDVERFVRSEGYFLAEVFLPAQTVTDGVVELALLPGMLGELTVNGPMEGLIREELAPLEGSVLTRGKLETELYRVSQLPGLRTQASLAPAAQVGATALTIDVLEERSFAGLVQIDNYGLEDTGEERLGARLSWRNPLKRGDVLELGLRTSVDPADQQQIWGRYALPLKHSPYRLEFFAGNNRYDFDSVRGVTLDLDGDSRLLEFGLRRSYWQTRTLSAQARVNVGFHDLRWRDFENQRLGFANLTVGGHRLWDQARLSLRGGAAIEYGRISSGTSPGQDEGFYRLSTWGRLWRPLSLPLLGGEQKLAFRWQLQYADSELPATRAMALGGPYLGRGFERAQFLADRAVNLALELRFPLPLGELVTFVDSAYGNGENDRDEPWGHLTSLGVGWDADWAGVFTSRVSFALPVTGDGSPAIDTPGPQFYWKLQYAY